MSRLTYALKRYSRQLILIGTTCISFFYFLWGVNSWKFAYIGDEWSFYSFARDLVEKKFLMNPFSFLGVYRQHAVLSSDYQALFLQVFGNSNFAWKLSNIILIFPLSFFFYLWVKNGWSKKIAMFSTILLQTSFYLANFFKIGYNNPQSLTLFILSLYLVTRYARNPTKRNGIFLGATLGFSFYIYLGPLFPFFIWPYLLPLLKKQANKKKVLLSALFASGAYLLVLFPLVFSPNSLDGPLRGMMAVGHGTAIKLHSNFLQIGINILHSFILFYKNNDTFYLHFVTGSYLDEISRIFCFLGTSILIFHVKQKKYFFLLLSYISTVIVINSTSPYNYASITRGIFFLPFGFLFAGIGLDFFIKQVHWIKISILLPIIFFIIFCINMWQSQWGVFHDAVGGYTGMALIIKEFQEASPAKMQELTIVLSPRLYITNYTYELPLLLQAYNLQNVPYQIIQPNELDCLGKKNKHVLLFQYDIEAMAQLGKLHCDPKYYTILSPQITYF